MVPRPLLFYLFLSYLWLLFWQDTFCDSINNILRVTVSTYKLLYQLEFFWKVFFEHIFFARSACNLIQAIFYFQKVKESMLMYCPVWVFFWKIVKSLGHISKSKNCGVSFSNLSTVNVRFLSKPLNGFNTMSISWRLTSNLSST